MNGISSHVFDFDDTHLKTVIHPAGPVASAILALAEHRPVSGTDFLNALVLGIEVECRIGNAVYPAHYDRGWHITGTAGVFGAAAACGKLLGLTEQQMVWALGLAATQPVGLREMFGSMTKSFHPGRAAQNGLTAALLAAAQLHQHRGGHRGEERVGERAEHRRATTRRSPTSSGRATRSRSTPTSRSPAASSSIRRSTPASSCATSTSWRPDRDRAHRPSRASAGARADRQEDAADRVSRASSASISRRPWRSSAGRPAMRDFSDENARNPVDRRAARPRHRDRRSGDQGRAGAGERSC